MAEFANEMLKPNTQPRDSKSSGNRFKNEYLSMNASASRSSKKNPIEMNEDQDRALSEDKPLGQSQGQDEQAVSHSMSMKSVKSGSE